MLGLEFFSNVRVKNYVIHLVLFFSMSCGDTYFYFPNYLQFEVSRFIEFVFLKTLTFQHFIFSWFLIIFTTVRSNL